MHLSEGEKQMAKRRKAEPNESAGTTGTEFFLCGFVVGEFASLAVVQYPFEASAFENASHRNLTQATLNGEIETFLGEYEAQLLSKNKTELKRIEHKKLRISKTVLAFGGAIDGDKVSVSFQGKVTDYHQQKIGRLMEKLGHSESVRFINDFEALALGIRYFFNQKKTQQDQQKLGNMLENRISPLLGSFNFEDLWEHASDGGKSLIVGPDAGLGVAAVKFGATLEDGMPYVEASEAGHETFSPEWQSAIEFALDHERHLSNEDVLSHRGLKSIYNYFRFKDGASPNAKSNHDDIITSAFGGNDQPAMRAVRFLCEYLGGFCGDLANIFKARHSLFLRSSMFDQIAPEYLRDHFSKRFSTRRRFSQQIEMIPVFVIKSNDFFVFGCAHLLECEADAEN